MLPQTRPFKEKDQRPQDVRLFDYTPVCPLTPEYTSSINYFKLIIQKIAFKQILFPNEKL